MYPTLKFRIFFIFILLLYSTEAEVKTKCGQHPFCQKFPDLCKMFSSRLLRGFIPGEIPFIARITVIENILRENSSTECVAVILSQRDLILNAKCFELFQKDTIVKGNYTGSRPVADLRIDKQPNQYRFENHLTYLFNNELALITLPENDENFSTDEIQKACIEAIPEFQIDGIVCGFSNESMDEEMELSCRTLKIFNDKNGENTMKFATSNQQNIIDDLKVGAAVFRLGSSDESEKNNLNIGTWKLIGFTNSEGGISTLSSQDCEMITSKTEGRVNCDSIDPASVGIAQNPFHPKIPSIDRTGKTGEDSQGSALFPAVIFGLILVLGIVLCAFAVRNSQNYANYDVI